jgi:hypothetical protein
MISGDQVGAYQAEGDLSGRLPPSFGELATAGPLSGLTTVVPIADGQFRFWRLNRKTTEQQIRTGAERTMVNKFPQPRHTRRHGLGDGEIATVDRKRFRS